MDLKLKSEQEIKMVSYKNPEDELTDISIKTIKVEEYEIKN